MDCATLCLLTAAVGFTKAPGTTDCSYCIDARSTYPDCFNDILECAYRDPESLIICANIYEHSESLVHHSVRCLSYAQFYIMDKDIKRLGEMGMCSYNQVQTCDCEQCPLPPPPPNTTTTSTTSIPRTTPTKFSHHHHHYSKTHKTRSGSTHIESLLIHNGTIADASAYREISSANSISSALMFVSVLLLTMF